MKQLIFLFFILLTFLNAKNVKIYSFEFPPYIEKKKGLAIEVLDELFKRAKLNYTINITPQTRSIQFAKDLKNNAVFPLQRSSEREAEFKWVGPILITQTAFFTLPNEKVELEVFNDIRNYQPVLVERGSADEEYLQGFGIKTQAVKSNLQNIKKLKIKRAKVWAADTIVASYFSKKTDIKIQKKINIITTIRSIAFNIDTPDETIDMLNEELQKMYEDGTVKNIFLKYSKKFNIKDTFQFLE